MHAEFSARGSFIMNIDVRTRMRDTLARYHILSDDSDLFIYLFT